MRFLKKAADQGHVHAAYELWSFYRKRQENENAVRWLTMTAEVGLPIAMYNLGVLLDNGVDGVLEPDFPAAADMYR